MLFDPNPMVMMRIKQEQEYGSENLATYASDRVAKEVPKEVPKKVPDRFLASLLGRRHPGRTLLDVLSVSHREQPAHFQGLLSAKGDLDLLSP